MIPAPLAAMLVQSAISRTREYAADRRGAEICGNPMWLASALEKLQRGAEHIDNPEAEKNPATAHVFIVNPLHARSIDNLFSTHPNTKNRVAALREMAAGGSASGTTINIGPPALSDRAFRPPAVSNADGAVLGTNGRSAKNQIVRNRLCAMVRP